MSDTIKKIHLATDHAGFEYKEEIKVWLQDLGYTIEDHGAHQLNEEDDFPDHISLAAEAVNQDPQGSRGIIFGGSGQGEAMLANSFPRVRATVFYGGDREIVRLSREHNDANMLSVGARFVSLDEVKDVIALWLETDVLTDQKYTRRNQKIEDITNRIHTSP